MAAIHIILMTLYSLFTFALTYNPLFLSFTLVVSKSYFTYVAIVFLSHMNVDVPILSMSKTISLMCVNGWLKISGLIFV